MLKLIFIGCALLLGLSGCAEIRASFCTSNAAYSSGVNDAHSGRSMDRNYASICTVDQASLNRHYRRGYQFGLRHQPRHVDIHINNRTHIDHYHHHHHRHGHPGSTDGQGNDPFAIFHNP